MTKAIIIEDEPKAAQELQDILISTGKIVIVKKMGSIEESLEWLSVNEQPDIIFSDIQLSDGISFDIFRKIKLSSPIIFCTAFDEYMLKAFEANGIGYLLKPLTISKVEDGLRKYEELKASFLSNRGLYSNQIDSLLAHVRHSYQTTLLVTFRDKIMPVKTEDIAFLYYSNGVVSISLFTQQQYFIQETMEELESKLNPFNFYRVNRQFIVHRNSILEIERYFSRKLIVKLAIGVPEPIVVSKMKSTLFLDWIQAKPA